MVALNHVVAVAMVQGAGTGLELLKALEDDKRLAAGHRLVVVRAHLLEMAGDHPAAKVSYEEAARRTTSVPQQRYLYAQAARLTAESGRP